MKKFEFKFLSEYQISDFLPHVAKNFGFTEKEINDAINGQDDQKYQKIKDCIIWYIESYKKNS